MHHPLLKRNPCSFEHQDLGVQWVTEEQLVFKRQAQSLSTLKGAVRTLDSWLQPAYVFSPEIALWLFFCVTSTNKNYSA